MPTLEKNKLSKTNVTLHWGYNFRKHIQTKKLHPRQIHLKEYSLMAANKGRWHTPILSTQLTHWNSCYISALIVIALDSIQTVTQCDCEFWMIPWIQNKCAWQKMQLHLLTNSLMQWIPTWHSLICPKKGEHRHLNLDTIMSITLGKICMKSKKNTKTIETKEANVSTAGCQQDVHLLQQYSTCEKFRWPWDGGHIKIFLRLYIKRHPCLKPKNWTKPHVLLSLLYECSENNEALEEWSDRK